MEWAEWSDEEAAARWNAALMTFPHYNLYQSYEWGEFKRQTGWQVLRGSITVDGRPGTLLQTLYRTWPLARGLFVWVPGGAAGNMAEGFNAGMRLRQRFEARFVFLRMNILRELNEADTTELAHAGWNPATVPVGYPGTFHIDLAGDETTRRGVLTSNWRHNLKRGEERGGRIEIWDPHRPLAPVYAVYQEMCRLQRISPAMSLAALDALRCSLGDAMTMAVALNEHGAVTAVRAFGRIGERAHDLLAAVTAEGRRIYANYPLMWKMLTWAKEQGARIYDLSGADPHGATGVFHFKKGLGGRMVTHAGEWDWASHDWLRRLVSVPLRVRRRALSRQPRALR